MALQYMRTITMETVLFGYFFFRANATAKFKLWKRKKIKKKRFGAGTKQMNEVNTSA